MAFHTSKVYSLPFFSEDLSWNVSIFFVPVCSWDDVEFYMKTEEKKKKSDYRLLSTLKIIPGCVKYATLRIPEMEEDSFELRIQEEWSLKD